MTDKDLLVIIAGMLRKQDQHTEMLSKQSGILRKQAEILEHNSEIMQKQTEILTETNNTIKQFVGISIKQFEEQQKFNEHLFGKVDDLEKSVIKAVNLEDRIQRLEKAVIKPKK